jgi:hypothetical protein
MEVKSVLSPILVTPGRESGVGNLQSGVAGAYTTCQSIRLGNSTDISGMQKLEAQERCDKSIDALVNGLSGILPFVEVIKKAVTLPQLQSTIAELVHLIEDASRFILDYKMDGAAGEPIWTPTPYVLIPS